MNVWRDCNYGYKMLICEFSRTYRFNPVLRGQTAWLHYPLSLALFIHRLRLFSRHRSLTSPQCWTSPFTFSSHPWMHRLTRPRPCCFTPPPYVLRLCLQINYLHQQFKLTLHSNLYQMIAIYRFWTLLLVSHQWPDQCWPFYSPEKSRHFQFSMTLRRIMKPGKHPPKHVLTKPKASPACKLLRLC